MSSPFDDTSLGLMRKLALEQAGGFYPNPNAASDAMTALYLIAALIAHIAALEQRLGGVLDPPVLDALKRYVAELGKESE